jgi:hypothetical protein
VRGDSRRRRRANAKDDGSREYKKGKRSTPGTENTRNNTDNSKRRRIIKDKSTEKDQSNNVQH